MSLEMLVKNSVKQAQDYALRIQNPSGYWRGYLESNATMEAEAVLMYYFLGIQDPLQNKKLVTQILNVRNSDGTWGNYYGAPGDISTTVEVYLALKLSGVDANSDELKRARDFILAQGGVEKCRTF